MPLTFVVGTGRCGSTLLSKVLRAHPDVLSIGEFFSALTVRGTGIPTGEYDGARMWDIISACDPNLDGLIRDGLRIAELDYPYGQGRFDPATGVPVICHMTLPSLTPDPDRLFDQLAAEVPGWPTRPAAEHYRALFALLARLLDRRVVVERSGASLALVAQLRQEFPEARFVHMHRDGPDCALSMSRHPGFRLMALAQHAARIAGVPSRAQLDADAMRRLPAELAELLSPPMNPTRLLDYQMPATAFGELWSGMLAAGLPALTAPPTATWIDLKYETLLGDPGTQLARLAGFIGVPARPDWVDSATRMLDPGRTGRAAATLDPAELAALEAACAPGQRTIAASGTAASVA